MCYGSELTEWQDSHLQAERKVEAASLSPIRPEVKISLAAFIPLSQKDHNSRNGIE